MASSYGSRSRGRRRQERKRSGRPRSRRRGVAVSPEIRQRILREVASGRTALEVARELGVHNTTISVWKRQDRERKEKEGRTVLASAESRAPMRRDFGSEAHPVAPLCAPKPTLGGPPELPRETGRYVMSFKDDVLAQVRSGRGVSEVARQYGIPEGTLQRWKREAGESGGELPAPKSTRPPTNATPLDEEHRTLVLSLKRQHPNMGLAQLQNQLKRFHALKVSRHLIGRIFAEAGIPLQKRSADTEGDPAKNRFEMSRPNELWAVDFKEIWIHSQKAYVIFLLDDFSRFCLGFALTENPTAELAIDVVRRAIQRYGRPERILSDRGAQFHAWNGVSKFDEFLADFFVDHTVTKADHPFTNGKIEAFNRSLESEVLDVEEFASLGEAEGKIRAHIIHYNFLRTHMGIDGLVPADRYFGMVQEARRALERGLASAGPGLDWLRGLVSVEGLALRPPSLFQLVLRDGKLECVVLGRRFSLG